MRYEAGKEVTFVSCMVCRGQKLLGVCMPLYCRELFGEMEDIKVHRVFDSQCPQGNRVNKLIKIYKTVIFYTMKKMLDSRTRNLYYSLNLALQSTVLCEPLRPLDTNIMFLVFIDLIWALLGQNGSRLCDCLIIRFL